MHPQGVGEDCSDRCVVAVGRGGCGAGASRAVRGWCSGGQAVRGWCVVHLCHRGPGDGVTPASSWSVPSATCARGGPPSWRDRTVRSVTGRSAPEDGGGGAGAVRRRPGALPAPADRPHGGQGGTGCALPSTGVKDACSIECSRGTVSGWRSGSRCAPVRSGRRSSRGTEGRSAGSRSTPQPGIRARRARWSRRAWRRARGSRSRAAVVPPSAVAFGPVVAGGEEASGAGPARAAEDVERHHHAVADGQAAHRRPDLRARRRRTRGRTCGRPGCAASSRCSRPRCRRDGASAGRGGVPAPCSPA